MENDGAGLGGVIRDSEGEIVVLFSTEAPKEDIFMLELEAIYKGIQLASSRGYDRIWLESDSLVAVQIISDQVEPPWKSVKILQQIKEKISSFSSWKISHIWREANSAADYLSKRSCPLKGVDLPPTIATPELLAIIRDDCEGKKYIRL
ncbi:uncharacterized protein LOC143865715 [Tasmannia lanceolata]|uniref:uncharacterized protein LOC143865715 n=1 Tax=Tasmannia lanceolata TaxID=3420 RepID=UPI004062BC59